MKYKVDEIKEYARDEILERIRWNDDVNADNYLDNDTYDIHHDIFNTDYYIIGRYEATQWLGNEVFNVIGFIKDYENDNFGEVTTDLSEAEHVVNMYVYIIGEEILEEVINEITDEQTKQNNTKQKASK